MSLSGARLTLFGIDLDFYSGLVSRDTGVEMGTRAHANKCEGVPYLMSEGRTSVLRLCNCRYVPLSHSWNIVMRIKTIIIT